MTSPSASTASPRLRPGTLFAGSRPVAEAGSRRSRVNTLGVQDHQGRVLRAAGSFTYLAAQEFVDDLVGAVVPSGGEVVRHVLRR